MSAVTLIECDGRVTIDGRDYQCAAHVRYEGEAGFARDEAQRHGWGMTVVGDGTSNEYVDYCPDHTAHAGRY